jgi:hypothetical protein
MFRRLLMFGSLIPLLMLPVQAAHAQDSGQLDLGLRRDFGFAAGGRIQGRFTLSAEADEDLVRVSFLIDGHVVCADTESPFRCPFSTSEFDLGMHTLSAAGLTAEGDEILAIELTVEFVSAEQGWSYALRIIGPILGVVLAATLLGIAGPVLLARSRRPLRPGEYGAAGGAICPRCRMPHSRNVLSPNLLLGKLEHCPHCGKWAVVRAATRADLEAAEERFRQESQRGGLEVADEGDRLRREIEDSRYEG